MTNSNVKERIVIKSLVAMLILMEFWFQLFLVGTRKREREREREKEKENNICSSSQGHSSLKPQTPKKCKLLLFTPTYSRICITRK
jgi:hypothetical protein